MKWFDDSPFPKRNSVEILPFNVSNSHRSSFSPEPDWSIPMPRRIDICLRQMSTFAPPLRGKRSRIEPFAESIPAPQTFLLPESSAM